MAAPNKEQIMTALQRVPGPDQKRDLVSAGMISGVQIRADGQVIFLITIDPQQQSAFEPLRLSAERAVQALPGVKKVTAILTAEKKPDPHNMGKNPPLTLPIRNIIAVASGKGGVGKSTVAVNLAAALAARGLKTGLLDADIYGPSVPRMTGLAGKKPERQQDDKIIPLEAHGLKVMSIGFLLQEEAPLIWRGPMVQTALYQLLRDVAWGTEKEPLDVLVIDLPPGTGDAQLTLVQKVPLTGAIIVSTPQDIALLDARKGLEMFRKVNVPVLGIIENMSTFICPGCGHEEHIFGHGGAKAEAEKLGCDFLGEIPLDIDIRKSGDEGLPVGADKKGQSFLTIADQVLSKIKKL